MLELKKGGHTRVQTEMVELIALPFQSSKNLKFGHFTCRRRRRTRAGTAKKCTTKLDARAELLFC